MATNLTASKLQSLKPTGKDYRLNDGNGLYIKVTKAGSKSWQFRYKGKWLGIGSYPAISLKQARDEAFKYNQMVASGKDQLGGHQIKFLTSFNKSLKPLKINTLATFIALFSPNKYQ